MEKNRRDASNSRVYQKVVIHTMTKQYISKYFQPFMEKADAHVKNIQVENNHMLYKYLVYIRTMSTDGCRVHETIETRRTRSGSLQTTSLAGLNRWCVYDTAAWWN